MDVEATIISLTYAVFGNCQYLHGIWDSQSGKDDNCNLVREVMHSGVQEPPFQRNIVVTICQTTQHHNTEDCSISVFSQ